VVRSKYISIFGGGGRGGGSSGGMDENLCRICEVFGKSRRGSGGGDDTLGIPKIWFKFPTNLGCAGGNSCDICGLLGKERCWGFFSGGGAVGGGNL
jgi:hypothetical protein